MVSVCVTLEIILFHFCLIRMSAGRRRDANTLHLSPLLVSGNHSIDRGKCSNISFCVANVLINNKNILTIYVVSLGIL